MPTANFYSTLAVTIFVTISERLSSRLEPL